MHWWKLPQGKESYSLATVARLGWAVEPLVDHRGWLPFFIGLRKR